MEKEGRENYEGDDAPLGRYRFKEPRVGKNRGNQQDRAATRACIIAICEKEGMDKNSQSCHVYSQCYETIWGSMDAYGHQLHAEF